MELSSEALLATLKSASTSSKSAYETEEIVMKLAKKNDQAVLSFEISGMTRQGRKVRVAHDVKIEVMKPADVARLEEPMCPEPNVRFTLLRFVADSHYYRSTSFSLLSRSCAPSSNASGQCPTFLQYARTTMVVCSFPSVRTL